MSDTEQRADSFEEAARAILESVTDAFFLLDRNFRFAYLNRTAERLLQRSDLVGKHIWTEFPSARGTRFEDAYVRAMNDATPSEFIEHYPPPLDRWYEVRAFPSPRGVSVYFQDVTERLKKDEEHRQHIAQMELVVRGADVGVWYCPLPFDVLIWDEKVKEHFHLAPDAHVTIDTFYERLHPDDRERTREAIAKSVDARVHYDIDYRTVSADGTRIKWIRAIGRAFYAADGSPTRFDGVTVDTSERKLAELAVATSEERYRLATRATNDVVWDWDLVTHEVRWNEALTVHFGHAVDATTCTASFWLGHVHPDDRSRVENSVRAVIDDASAELWQVEYRFLRADGSWVDVLDRGYVVRDAAGKGTRMIGAMQDLSERKRAERDRERVIEAERAARGEAERQNRMKDEFLATLSHELRTPLNAILGWAQILRGRLSPGDENARALEVITRNAKAQAKIVDDLLDMSHLLSGKIRLDVHRVAFGALVEASIDTARPMAETKNVELVSKVSSATSREVLGDAARLQQVMWNLLVNAVKFTPAGGTVEVALEQSSRTVSVQVRDDGEGIDGSFLPFVFDRFRQQDGSISRRHGGLGLGLSIVKQIVEAHGGQVIATSEGPGLGSTFTVTLPRALDVGRSRSDDTSRERSSASSRDADIRGLRVLVVDDEADARQLVCRILEDHGATATSAQSAAQALEALDGARFDVLVSDIGMPREDLYSLLRGVRTRPPEKNGAIPAVAVTAYARAEDRVQAVAAGFLLHVAKPVDGAELVTMVAAAAGRFG